MTVTLTLTLTLTLTRTLTLTLTLTLTRTLQTPLFLGKAGERTMFWCVWSRLLVGLHGSANTFETLMPTLCHGPLNLLHRSMTPVSPCNLFSSVE